MFSRPTLMGMFVPIQTVENNMAHQHRLPAAGFLRLRDIIGDRKANPPIPALIPVGKSTWWDGVRTGRYPRPRKLGPRTTAWRVEDILSLIDRAATESAK
jgi:prophage regulatory protein